MNGPTFLAALWLLSCAPAFAHDEGHGPKLTDTGKYGGLVSAVVASKEAKLGPKAKLQFKAELVRSSSGKIQLYLYDAAMKPVDVASWDKVANVTMATTKKGKWVSKEFTLNFQDQAFTGQMPTPLGHPFHLDFRLKNKDQELLAAFDNLD